MSLFISVPGKTFLAGEYLALKEGPTLVFLSEPRFELEVQIGAGKLIGLHPQSPAGLFVNKFNDYFKKYDLRFHEAYQGKGGFGASTAQFLAVYALWLSKEFHHLDMEKLIDIKHLLSSYYDVSWSGVGHRPSGADLVGQLKGTLCFFDKKTGMLSIKNWVFEDLSFYLLHTGNKVATHEHLKTLPDFDAKDLYCAFSIVKKSFDDNNSEAFITGINAYSEALSHLGFTCSETLALLRDIKSLSGVVAAKGCGALGADVVLVVTRKNQESCFLEFCTNRNLSIMSSQNNISQGIQVRGQL